MQLNRLWGLTLPLLVSGTSSQALADPLAPNVLETPPSITWPERYRRTSTFDLGLVGASALVTGVGLIIGPRSTPWKGGILFDEAVRDALLPSQESTRRTARDLSDVLLSASWTYPLVFDALGVVGGHHRSPDVAKQMLLIDLEVFSISLAIQTAVKAIASRERPYVRTCGQELPENTSFCNARRRSYSFFSGHTSQAFAAAASMCQAHRYLDLYQGAVPPWLTCSAGFAVASATGLLRVVGDQHYTSDVLVGAAVGTSVGLLVPWLLHYRVHSAESSSKGESRFHFALIPNGNGVSFTGAF